MYRDMHYSTERQRTKVVGSNQNNTRQALKTDRGQQRFTVGQTTEADAFPGGLADASSRLSACRGRKINSLGSERDL